VNGFQGAGFKKGHRRDVRWNSALATSAIVNMAHNSAPQ
jgi:hypothetical protein